MIKDIGALTVEDKLLMLYNKESFSYPTQVSIDYHRSEWNQEIEMRLSTSKVAEMDALETKVWNDARTVTDKGDAPLWVKTKMTNLCNEVKKMPSETREDVADIILYFGMVITPIMQSASKDRSIDIDYVKDNIDSFFKTILPWKLTAHEVSNRSGYNVRPADDHAYIFSYQCLRQLISEYMNDLSREYIAVVIYLIASYLKQMDNKTFTAVMVNSYAFRYSYNQDDLSNTVQQIISGDTTALKIIDSISDIKHNIWSQDIIQMGKRKLTENYEKEKICDRLNHGGLCIGDNVFGDEAVSLNELVIEMDKLSDETIKDYVGENQIVSFKVDEREVGYLKVREKLPICKLLMPKAVFYTITRYEDNSYLLFKLYGDSKLYGISFPSGYQGLRKVVVFDIPQNLDYKLDEV